MAALNHALMIPGLIIITVLLWAWMPIACLVCCLRRAGRRAHGEQRLLEGGHASHPGFGTMPPSHPDAETPRRLDEHAGAAAHYYYRQKQEERVARTRRDERARRRPSSEGSDESRLLKRPEHLATRESGRQRRLMDESRGYPSQD